MTATADRWLNYADAAALLGLTTESLRQRARREHWGKKLGNEGKALVLVPLDAARNTGGDTAGEAPGQPHTPRPVKRPEPDPVAIHIAALEARAAELRVDLDQARQDRDRERDERLAERERAEKIAGELAALANRFATAPDDARSRETALAERLAAMQADATAQLAAVKTDATAREEALTAKLATTNADAVTIQARLDALQNDMTTMRARSWLRRLIG